MTFLELQNQIVQTRKARKGIKNREDYFQDDETEEFWTSVKDFFTTQGWPIIEAILVFIAGLIKKKMIEYGNKGSNQ